ncbi:MAG: type I secretion C-terminal target domain-containing protein, partial [Alphaproteobacteria bacterium]|nr:type I secretion C-terminal target domain-containing protein [Alphaproteobacteria bacterium]MBV9899556.1 type I secretion C-terminal target domain-containing protein [Alphaproteobacteria bacterium]
MTNIIGTSGYDTLNGTSGDDHIEGLGAGDTISGGDGSDEIFGGEDNDVLRGDGGDDFLYGGAGYDYILDGLGNDYAEGGEGGDSFSSYNGNDTLDGGAGDDRFSIERLNTGETVHLIGGTGSDSFSALITGTGSLFIDAGEGDDRIELRGTDGVYALSLGSGSDLLTINGYASFNRNLAITVADFETGASGDRLDLSSILSAALTGWDSEQSPFATGHLRLVQSGTDAVLQIDTNGGGNGFFNLITFSNSSAAAFTYQNLDGFPADGTIPAGQTLTGTEDVDSLVGAAGDDTIDGLGSRDQIWGGAGDDVLNGGEGDDDLFGEWGADSIDGGAGRDYIDTGSGRYDDVVHGGDDGDFINNNGGGNATLYGDAGDDYIGIQRSFATPDTVTANGGAGNDTLSVFAYGNHLFLLDGGTGDDLVRIGWLQGTADVTLGDGADRILFDDTQKVLLNYGSLIVRDFQTGAGGDRLDFDAWLTDVLTGWDQQSNPFGTGHVRLVQSGSDTLLQVDRDGPGTAAAFRTIVTFKGTDAASFVQENLDGFPADGSPPAGVTLIGTTASETLTGTAGADRIEGRGGNDTLRGEAGNDILIGGPENDTIYGGSGNDTIDGGNGGGILDGEAGDDVITAGSGADFISLGNGADIAHAGDGADFISLYGYPGGLKISSAFGEGGADSFSIRSYYAADFRADGGSGNDNFDVGAVTGATTLTLGAGSDRITFASDRFNTVSPGTLAVTDFAAGAGGDLIDLPTSLGALVTGWTSSDNPFLTGHLRLVQSGADTILEIDRNGGGDSFVPLVTLQGLSASTLSAANLGFVPTFVYGTAGNDVLDGADAPADGAGADVLKGGAGNDVYVVGAGDTVVELAGEGIDEVRTALGSKTDYAQLYVLPDNVENLTGTSASAQGVRGNGLDNVVTMGGGNDLIVLDDGGNDRASGGGGNDFIYYGAAWTTADKTD